jgi:hypothetical protein
VGRNWFINHAYNGCPADDGWLVITSGESCLWERNPGAPVRVLYAPGTTRQNWTTGASEAEVFAVFAR